MDAILCGENSFLNAAKMLKEVQRILKIGGYYMMISYGTPDARLLHLKRKFEKFDIQVLKIDKNYVDEKVIDKHHYIYLCQKLEGADEASKENFDDTIKELTIKKKIEDEKENEKNSTKTGK